MVAVMLQFTKREKWKTDRLDGINNLQSPGPLLCRFVIYDRCLKHIDVRLSYLCFNFIIPTTAISTKFRQFWINAEKLNTKIRYAFVVVNIKIFQIQLIWSSWVARQTRETRREWLTASGRKRNTVTCGNTDIHV